MACGGDHNTVTHLTSYINQLSIVTRLSSSLHSIFSYITSFCFIATPNLVSLLSSPLPLSSLPLALYSSITSTSTIDAIIHQIKLNNTNYQLQWLELSKPHESPLVEKLPESSVSPLLHSLLVNQLINSRHQGCPKDRIQDCWWSYRWC